MKSWEHFRTKRSQPSKPDEIHLCGFATVHRINAGNVRFSYLDQTTIGEFSGRDNLSVEEFQKVYPIKLENQEENQNG